MRFEGKDSVVFHAGLLVFYARLLQNITKYQHRHIITSLLGISLWNYCFLMISRTIRQERNQMFWPLK